MGRHSGDANVRDLNRSGPVIRRTNLHASVPPHTVAPALPDQSNPVNSNAAPTVESVALRTFRTPPGGHPNEGVIQRRKMDTAASRDKFATMNRFPVAIAALSIAASFALTGCSSDGPVLVESAAPVEAVESESPTPTPTSTPAPASELGTRDNPIPINTVAKHSTDSVWNYSVGETDTDAWPEIQAVNQFNTAPPEGSAYVAVPVAISLDDVEAVAQGADPLVSFAFEYVTAAGNSYDEFSCNQVLPAPGDLFNIGTMYGGAQASFIACASVPVADVPGGTWKVTSQVDFSSTAFFAGPPA